MTVKRYTKKEKTVALKRLKAGESASVISRDLKIPRTTLLGWKNDEATGARPRKKTAHVREDKSDTLKTENEIVNVDKPQEEEAPTQENRKQAFSKYSWENIEKAQRLIDRRLSRALDYEKELDEIVNIVLEATDEEVDYKQKMVLINKLKQIRVTDLRDIVVLIGTLYDKQALANNEANEKLSLAQDKPFEIVVTVKK